MTLRASTCERVRAGLSRVTTMRPDGATATSEGQAMLPLPGMPDPSSRASVPLGWNIQMRSLPVSATAIIPDGPTSMPPGQANCPSTSPPSCDLNLKANVPLGWKTETMWLKSTTAIRPDGATATSTGQASCPPPLLLPLPTSPPPPYDPNLKANVPFGWKTCTRWLSVSATAIIPDGPTSMPPGQANCPSPEPFDPNLKANVPFGWKTCTRSLPVSETAIRPDGPTATKEGPSNCPSPEPYEPNTNAAVSLPPYACAAGAVEAAATATAAAAASDAVRAAVRVRNNNSTVAPLP